MSRRSATPLDAGRSAAVRPLVAGVLAVVVMALFALPACIPDNAGPITALASGFRADRLVSNVETVSSMALERDAATGAPKRLYFAEQPRGEIRVYDFATDRVQPQPFAALPVAEMGEAGLLSIALSPTFEEDRYVYVLATLDTPLRTKLIRYRENGAGLGLNPTVIVENLPAKYFNNGGGLAFLEDGTVLVGVGDTGNGSRAQAEEDEAGRVLRYRDDGTWPMDNPFAGTHEYARGFRDPLAMAKWQGTGGIFIVDRGEEQDRLVYLQRGKNYAWPEIPSGSSVPDPGQIVATFSSNHRVRGMAFHDGTNLPPEFAGDLFVAFEGSRQVRRLTLTGALNTTLVEHRPFVIFDAEQPQAVMQMPDGSLLVATDRSIWRIVPIGFVPPPNDDGGDDNGGDNGGDPGDPGDGGDGGDNGGGGDDDDGSGPENPSREVGVGAGYSMWPPADRMEREFEH